MGADVMSKRYRATTAERVAAAQAIANKHNGVTAIQESKSLPDSSAFILANPDRYEVLPNNYGDAFLSEWMTVPHG